MKSVVALVVALAFVASVGCASRRALAPTEDPPPVRLVAVSWRGEFFATDPSDGVLVSIGHTGFSRINSLTVTPDNRVLSVAQMPGGNPVLIDIDPDTGRGTVVCVLDRLVDVRALAAAPDGMLYAMIARPDEDDRSTLILIDAASGHVRTLRDYGVSGINAMEFNRQGELCAHLNWNRRPSPGRSEKPLLVRISPQDWTMHGTPSDAVDRDIQSLAFDAHDGVCIAWQHSEDRTGLTSYIQHAQITAEGVVKILDFVATTSPADIRGIGFLGEHRREQEHQ